MREKLLEHKPVQFAPETEVAVGPEITIKLFGDNNSIPEEQITHLSKGCLEAFKVMGIFERGKPARDLLECVRIYPKPNPRGFTGFYGVVIIEVVMQGVVTDVHPSGTIEVDSRHHKNIPELLKERIPEAARRIVSGMEQKFRERVGDFTKEKR